MEHPPPSRLICPTIRPQYNSSSLGCKIISGEYFSMIDNSYSLHDVSSHDDHRLDPLYWCNNKNSRDEPSWCRACECKESSTTYYYCNGCKLSYHKECVESSPLIKSPHHPKHPLQLIILTSNYLYPKLLSCSYCGSSYRDSFLLYYCFICEFSLDPICAIRPSFLNYQKRHEHTLNHFPRKTDLICDVCGLIDSKCLIYVCLECGFVVHTKCIHLPFVIRISRHNHRLSFTYSPPLRVLLFCGVCHQKVDGNYGKYCCLKDCTYVVHSKCATRRDVWDEKELEQEPEEEEYENLNSFEVIGDGIIQHFSHSHHLKFEKKTTGILHDENKLCQACVLPFYGGDVYNCMDSKCDFVLHEACANLPRTIQHMAHPYPFILQVSDINCFFCGYCYRLSFGFRYFCSKGDEYEYVSLDTRCAAISEPFDHQSHPHPLFLSNELGKYRPCSICRKESIRTLNCIECDFCLCFYCATLPYRIRYEHDEHFLTLSYEENASPNWCEVCEETLDSYKWLYICKECGVAFHIACLLGKCAFYVKPAQNLLFNDQKFNIVLRNGLTRPICKLCKSRCHDKLMYQELTDGEEITACYRHWEVINS
ncbi:hypothetical protein N665_0005s0189 [Sinapis alba]|nr:hypothetical protein N665_0005s0189 [Sinapis alba]